MVANKIALITGSSKGIGAGIALELAKAGADICINYYASSTISEDIVSQIRAIGRRAIAVQADVSQPDQVEKMVDICEQELGNIDILVTNAIASVRNTLLETKFEDLHRTIEIGLYGVFHICQIVATRMVNRNNEGSIIHISSPHAHFPYRGAIDYNVAKAASHHLVLSMANELRMHKIRVNILEPGWTDTPGERRWYSDSVLKSLSAQMPLGRMASPEDLGKAAVFLASDAAKYIIGSVLKVDGGLYIEGTPSLTANLEDMSV